MNTRHTYLMVSVSTSAEDEHRILLRWPVMTQGLDYSEVARKLAFYTSSPGERVKVSGLMMLPDNFSVHSLSVSLDWTMQQMFEPTRGLHHFQMSASIKVSGHLVSYSRRQEKPSTLVLPSQIDFAGSIATILRTQEVTSYALSLYSGEGWQRMRRGQFVVRTVNKSLLRNSAIPTVGRTRTGSRTSKRMRG